MNIDHIVLVVKKTDYERLILRHASVTQATFALGQKGDSLEGYARAHQAYERAIAAIHAQLPQQIPFEVIDQERATLYPWRKGQLIIVCGPDGLFVNLAKSITDQLVITVNPDPTRVNGKIMMHAPDDVGGLIKKILADTATVIPITLGKVTTNDGQELYAVNDFLVGRNDQRAARYSIQCDGREEQQCSSGVIVSAPMGATGWIKSVMDTARGLCGGNGGGSNAQWPAFSGWNERKLAFIVREAFASVDTGTSLLKGYVAGGNAKLVIRSLMPEGGVIFSDGMTDAQLDFGTGITATFSVAGRTVNFVGK
jgi:hypothetical protein